MSDRVDTRAGPVDDARVARLFDEQERAAWGGFIAAQSKLFRLIEDDLRRRFGITHTEFEVLLRLSRSKEGRARLQDLAAKSLLSRSGTSRAVERLERAGYVEREGAEEDGRGAYAVLTQRGREHFQTAATEHVALVRREFLSRFTRGELEALGGYWKRINDEGEESEARPTVKGSPGGRSAR